jgi:hypothetical protein
VLPLALSVLGENRTRSAIAAAFNQFNNCVVGTNCLTEADISEVAFRLFNLRNPVTGGFILPSISRFTELNIRDQTGTGSFQFGNFPNVVTRTLMRNNPLVVATDVIPAEFRQNQFTTRLDGQLSIKNSISGTLFWSDFPGLDPFPDPSSLASPFTLRRADRNRTLSIGNSHIFSPTFVNEIRFGYFFLNNTRRLDDPFLTNELSNEAVGIQNPASTFDSSEDRMILLINASR